LINELTVPGRIFV